MHKKVPLHTGEGLKCTCPKHLVIDNTTFQVYNCPNEAVQMNCLSCKTKVYRKCPVVGASLVTAVSEAKFSAKKNACVFYLLLGIDIDNVIYYYILKVPILNNMENK